MIWFGPSLLIISAGFDAHDDDPLADLELTEEDYYWATQACLLACRCCSLIKSHALGVDSTAAATEVKCVSILEGGYHLEAISKSSIAHVNALFARSDRPAGDETSGDKKIGDEHTLLETLAATEAYPVVAPPQDEEAEEAGERMPKVSVEDLLAGLDQSIGSLLMEALMSIPDPEGEDSDGDYAEEADGDGEGGGGLGEEGEGDAAES
jgi:hypothetical protein